MHHPFSHRFVYYTINSGKMKKKVRTIRHIKDLILSLSTAVADDIVAGDSIGQQEAQRIDARNDEGYHHSVLPHTRANKRTGMRLKSR